ncbi:MAG: hypothetical protein JO292_02955 [Betaproteobacteria bacterium]|nr:hypothetical protein [Betaproteobacteria bacterium]MBV9360328.1 hypothetical protein [Betaproteobacteria bacterium]
MKGQKPEFVPAKSRFLRRRRIVKAASDVERGLKDTERRGVPNDVPGNGNGSRRRRV